MIIKHIGGNQYTVNVDGDMTVKELRETIMERAGVPVDKQHLHFAGKELRDNNATLTSLGINNASEVQFHGKLNGGCGLGCEICGNGCEACCTIV